MFEQDEIIDKLRELTTLLHSFVRYDSGKGSVIEYDTSCGTVIGFGLYKSEEVGIQRAFLLFGAILPRHRHDQTEILIPYTGTLKVTIDGETKLYRPGEVCILPPNIPHTAEAVEDTYVVGVTVPADKMGYPDA